MFIKLEQYRGYVYERVVAKYNVDNYQRFNVCSYVLCKYIQNVRIFLPFFRLSAASSNIKRAIYIQTEVCDNEEKLNNFSEYQMYAALHL